jgi:hypothetical protein
VEVEEEEDPLAAPDGAGPATLPKMMTPESSV